MSDLKPSFQRYLPIHSQITNFRNPELFEFYSISDYIYLKDEETYLESIFFGYLLYIFDNKEENSKYDEFVSRFSKKIKKIKEFFLQNRNHFTSISAGVFQKSSEMLEKLQKVLNLFQVFYKEERSHDKEAELLSSKNKFNNYFRMIMQIMILSSLNEREEDSKTQKLIKKVCQNKIKCDNAEINKIITTSFKINFSHFFENEKNTEYYKFKKDDKWLAFFIKKSENSNRYSILSKTNLASLELKEKLLEEFENNSKKANKKHRKELRVLSGLYSSSQNIYFQIIAEIFDYMTALCLKEENAENLKQKLKGTIKQGEKAIFKQEKKLNQEFGLQIDSGNLFKKIKENFKAKRQEFESEVSMKSEPKIDNKSEISIENEDLLCCLCKRQKQSQEITEFDCGCKFCSQCLQPKIADFVSTNKGTLDLPCFNEKCSEPQLNNRGLRPPESNVLLEKTLGKAKYEEILAEYKRINFLVKSSIKPISIEKLKLECPVCNLDFEIEYFVTFDCDCRLCEDCCKAFLNSEFNKGSGFKIKCFNENCKAPERNRGLQNAYFVTERLFDKKFVEKISEAIASQHAKFQCANPECRLPFELDREKTKVDFFLCDVCKTSTCINCKNVRHPGRNCELDPEIKSFLKKEGQRTRICPNPKCLAPQTKDEGCEHVTCSACKKDWCFSCSMLRSPILAHGNHYHRKDCIHYIGWIDDDGNEVFDDVIRKDCEECKTLGKLCERPKLTMREFYIENKVEEYLEIVEKPKEIKNNEEQKLQGEEQK